MPGCSKHYKWYKCDEMDRHRLSKVESDVGRTVLGADVQQSIILDKIIQEQQCTKPYDISQV